MQASPSSSDSSTTPAASALVVTSAGVHHSRRVAVVSLLLLILLCLAWELFLAPVRPGGSWLALKALPLCIPLAGLLKNRMYTYRWLSLMVWLYVTEGSVRAWSDRAPSNFLALLEVVLCLVLFTACTAHIRLRLRSAKQAAAQSSGPASSAPV